MVLGDYRETIGNLRDVKDNEDNLTLVFAIDYEIEIPKGAIPYDKIKTHVGDRIGILNAGNNVYRIRKISKNKTKKLKKSDKNERKRCKEKRRKK